VTGAKRYLPLAASLVMSIIFGFAYFFIKLGMSVVGQDAVKYLAFRFTLGFIVLSLLLLVGFQKVNLKGKPVYLLLLCGLLNPLMSQVLETMATTHAPTSQIAIFFSLSPIFIVIFSILINREIPTKRQIFFMAVIITGLLLINLVDGQMEGGTTLGLILVLSASVVISMHLVVMRRASGSFTPFEIIYIATGMGAVAYSSTTVITHAVEGRLGSFFDGLWTFDFVVSILYMGIASCVVAHLCKAYANSRLPIAVSTSVFKLSTVIVILVGVFILGETIRPIDIVGMSIAFVGVVGISFSYNASASNRFKLKKDAAGDAVGDAAENAAENAPENAAENVAENVSENAPKL